MAHTPKQCTATNRDGRQCRSWAIHGQSLCSVHAKRNAGGGGQAGNQNAKKHGFYGRHFTPEELAAVEGQDLESLDGEISAARIQTARIMDYMERNKEGIEPDTLTRLQKNAFEGMKTTAVLLRTRRALTGETGDGLSGAFATILDELASEWGIEL
jgi:uncharacterized protein YjcR